MDMKSLCYLWYLFLRSVDYFEKSKGQHLGLLSLGGPSRAGVSRILQVVQWALEL